MLCAPCRSSLYHFGTTRDGPNPTRPALCGIGLAVILDWDGSFAPREGVSSPLRRQHETPLVGVDVNGTSARGNFVPSTSTSTSTPPLPAPHPHTPLPTHAARARWLDSQRRSPHPRSTRSHLEPCLHSHLEPLLEPRPHSIAISALSASRAARVSPRTRTSQGGGRRRVARRSQSLRCEGAAAECVGRGWSGGAVEGA